MGGTAAAGGAAGSGAGGANCIGPPALGFAYNPGCDGGSTAPTACHAACTLNGAPYVGCALDDRAPGGVVTCHASCADCP